MNTHSRKFFAAAAALLLAAVFLVQSIAFAADALDEDISRTASALARTVSGELGVGDEWTVLALRAAGASADFESYAANALLGGSSVGDTVERQRVALTLYSLGHGGESYVADTPDKTVFDENGIMSYIFGLHLANNGVIGARASADIIAELDARRNGDGGWSVFGSASDVDVTAMALSALAPNKGTPAADELIDGALALLSSRQNDDGGFSSFGTENCESSAQVIIALASLGIDPDGDPDFTKNGHTVYSALAAFRTEDGGYRHTANGEGNRTATVQALLALTAYRRYIGGKSPLFVFDTDASAPTPAPVETAGNTGDVETEKADADTDTAPAPAAAHIDYKPIAAAVIAAAAFAAFAVLFFACKSRNVRDYIIVLLVAAALLAAVFFIKIESPSEHFAPGTSADTTGVVTFSVDASAVGAGIIVPPCAVGIGEGSTVLSVTEEAARRAKIVIDIDAAGTYIRSINGISERDFGALSGWVFRVNGEYPNISCADLTLSPGDTVEWIYTTEPVTP